MTTALKSIAAVAAFALLALLSGCGKKSSSMQSLPLAKVACDESFENIMEQEINVYEIGRAHV